MKKIAYILVLGTTLTVFPMEQPRIVPHKPFRNTLGMYLGGSMLCSYLSMNLYNKNIADPAEQKDLITYAVGTPLILGLGIFLSSRYTKLKLTEEIDLFCSKDSRYISRFLTSYLIGATGISSAIEYGVSYASKNPLDVATAILLGSAQAGTACSMLASTYLASLMYTDLYDKSPLNYRFKK